MKNEEELYKLADFFKALSDPQRLKLLFMLSERDMCVCELAEKSGSSESAVSHQLRFLRAIGVVKCRKEGKFTVYALTDKKFFSLFEIYEKLRQKTVRSEVQISS